jgi:hypothetical protein
MRFSRRRINSPSEVGNKIGDSRERSAGNWLLTYRVRSVCSWLISEIQAEESDYSHFRTSLEESRAMQVAPTPNRSQKETVAPKNRRFKERHRSCFSHWLAVWPLPYSVCQDIKVSTISWLSGRKFSMPL